MSEETLRDQIDNIMDTFDFGRVREIMDALDWKWSMPAGGSGVPEEVELRQSARRLLRSLRECSITSSGGFTAVLSDDGVMLFWGIDSIGGE